MHLLTGRGTLGVPRISHPEDFQKILFATLVLLPSIGRHPLNATLMCAIVLLLDNKAIEKTGGLVVFFKATA